MNDMEILHIIEGDDISLQFRISLGNFEEPVQKVIKLIRYKKYSSIINLLSY